MEVNTNSLARHMETL